MGALDETAVGREAGGLTGSDETFGFTTRPRPAVGDLDVPLPTGIDLGGVTILQLLGSGGMGLVVVVVQMVVLVMLVTVAA